MKVDAWAMSDVGLVRSSNEDSVGCFPELNLFIVADGMGGHADGEVASRMAVEVIRESLAEERTASVTSEALRRVAGQLGRLLRPSHTTWTAGERFDPRRIEAAVRVANQRIFEFGRAHSTPGQEHRLGTTVVVLKVTRERAYWAHVGDSRLYRVRNGTLQLLTADHTLYGMPYLGNPNVPLDLPHTNKLVQALGMQPDVKVATSSDRILSGDLFFLCSDGICGPVDAAVIHEQLTMNQALEDAGRNLIRLALEAGGRDNASVLLVRSTDD